jgi:hypothetical protein
MSDLVGRGVKAISKQRYNAEKSGVRDVRSGQTKSMQRCICVRIDVQLSSHDFLRDLAFDVVLDSVSVLTTAAQLAKRCTNGSKPEKKMPTGLWEGQGF